MIGYKVVRVLEDESYISVYAPSIGVVCYELNKPTERIDGNGPLALFEDIESAKDFHEVHHGYTNGIWVPMKIFKCEFKPSENAHLWVSNNAGSKWTMDYPVPPGTTYADEVTLLEEIEVEPN